ncbi:MAG: asparagine synthase (glutamine-hydrolyzing), partial [Bacteroidota bacterium]|nr:asparagine synthase (glutamine-hydrolyzing) [Bacteroidota bacterium]
DYAFQTQTDTEVILAAYDCYKEDCLQYFDGMFAFAIWDEKEKILFAARDRFGEKPFFYYFDDEQFVFASEMKALWAAGIRKEVNLKMSFNFLTIGYVDNPNDPDETFFENISKLPAAHFLKLKSSDHELIIEKYWDIDFENNLETITDQEAINKFNELFLVSIKRRMRSDVPVGTSLSGGLDSSSVLALSCGLGAASDSRKSFSAIFPGFEKDEACYAKQVASQLNIQNFATTPLATDLVDNFEKLMYHQEEPFASSGILAQYKVYELAKQHNVTVLLDGQGADETLAGYHKYYKWYWQELFRKRKLSSTGEVKSANKLGVKEHFGLKNVIAALFPDFASVFLERQYLANALSQEDLNRDFIHLQSKEAYYTTPAMFTLNGALYFNTCIHGLEELLRYADRNSMANAREVRLPFLNHELVEFIFSLPSKFKIRQGWPKWLLRKSMENQLPNEIIWRKDKVGFEPPQLLWMQDKRVQDAIHEAKKKLVAHRILKTNVPEKKIQPHNAYAAESYDWRYLVTAALL